MKNKVPKPDDLFGRVEEEERRRGEGIRSRIIRDLTLPAGSYLASDPLALRGRVKAGACVLSYHLEFTRYTQ